jgi:tripartite ATP-independent transporter DctM subunit
MSPEIVGVIGIIALIVFILARMWIGPAMAIVGILGIFYIKGFSSAAVIAGTVPYQNLAFYPITTIPLFLLMGVVIFNSGVGEEVYNTAYKLVGQLRGGLAMATVIACALLASITGHSGAAVVAMGKVAMPEMKKHNYDEKLATGCIVCGGTLAFLIPPSLAFIVYAILTEQSVGKLFMAGILPGILLASLFVVTIMIITLLRPQAGPAGPKTSLKEKIASLKGTWHVIILFLLVLGGIYGGIFTPTEAGAIGAFGAIIIAVASRRLTLRGLFDSFLESAQTTAMITLLMVGAFIFIKFVALSKVTFMLSGVIDQLAVPPMLIFAGIVLLYIILGMFLDIFGAVMLTIPIIYPVITALGFDPIWFGVILVILIEMGLVTPPIGFDAFMLSGVTGIPVGTVFRGVWPFCIAAIICIIILTVFPQIALFIPSTM